MGNTEKQQSSRIGRLLQFIGAVSTLIAATAGLLAVFPKLCPSTNISLLNDYICKPMVAKFDWEQIPDTHQVIFINQSKGFYNTATWTFGDGTSATGSGNVTHDYQRNGEYNVTLTISSNGDTNTYNKIVEIPPPGIYFAHTFDDDSEQWMVVGDAFLWHAVPENDTESDKAICGRDGVMGKIWYFQAPYSGDFADLYGETLFFQLYVETIGSPEPNKSPDIKIVSPQGTMIYDIPDLDKINEWISYTIRFEENAGWVIDHPERPDATREQIINILSTLEKLQIRGVLVTGVDRECLDNVYLGVQE